MKKKIIPKVLYAEKYLARLGGMMGRRKWPRSYFTGLYFPKCKSVHTFFTFLKLDIVFLDKNNKILKIFSSASPWRFFLGPAGSRHCLELPGGYSNRIRLKNGDEVQCEKI